MNWYNFLYIKCKYWLNCILVMGWFELIFLKKKDFLVIWLMIKKKIKNNEKMFLFYGFVLLKILIWLFYKELKNY